tara:strand:+ start:6976 stop:8094 length:1119 start_codon:yes stop_codon:yes gene_type:complete
MKHPNNPIPFFGVSREFAQHRAEFMNTIESVLATGQVLQGTQITDLEKNIANITNRSYAVAVNSCTDALYFSLVASGIKPGDEVLVPNFTFAASATCILRLGAKPILVDIDENFALDLNQAQSLINPKTKAIIFVHLYGQMHDPDTIESFSKQNNLVLVEDAAQSLGAKYKNRIAGSMGLTSCISFDPTKTISAPGSGGVLTTNDSNIATLVRSLRYHGKDIGSKTFNRLGYNSQMTTIAAALISQKLNYLKKWENRRIDIAKIYKENLLNLNQITLPKDISESQNIYHKFVLEVEQRDNLFDHLKNSRIGTAIHYETPLHREPMFSFLNLNDNQFEVSLNKSKKVISLPIHPFLTDSEIEIIIQSIKSFYK